VLPADVAPDPCGNAESVKKAAGIVIGITLAKNLGVSLGDCMQVTSPTIGYTFSQGSIRPPIAKQFRVISIFEAVSSSTIRSSSIRTCTSAGILRSR